MYLEMRSQLCICQVCADGGQRAPPGPVGDGSGAALSKPPSPDPCLGWEVRPFLREFLPLHLHTGGGAGEGLGERLWSDC